MQSRGLVYNPEVIAIYTNIEESHPMFQSRRNINLNPEFELREYNEYKYIDTSDTLEDSSRPAGQVTISTGYTKEMNGRSILIRQ